MPRSIARVSPPVCRARWKFRSRCRRWVKMLEATRRMAFWATEAKMALRSSWARVAPMRVAPSSNHHQ